MHMSPPCIHTGGLKNLTCGVSQGLKYKVQHDISGCLVTSVWECMTFWIYRQVFVVHYLTVTVFIWLGLDTAQRQILESRSCLGLSICPFVHLSPCPFDRLSGLAHRMYWTNSVENFPATLTLACHMQHVHKQTESDICRLKVCSFFPGFAVSSPDNGFQKLLAFLHFLPAYAIPELKMLLINLLLCSILGVMTFHSRAKT